MKKEDEQFAAFEIEVKFYEFNRLPFEVTIKVPAFHKIIDYFVNQNKLEWAYPYLYNEKIGGKTKEDHDKSVKVFSSAAGEEIIVIMNKNQFCLKEIPMQGHMVSSGSQRPDPERRE